MRRISDDYLYFHQHIMQISQLTLPTLLFQAAAVWLLLQPTHISGDLSSRDTLDLTTVDTVRVLLFDSRPPQQISIKPGYGEVTFRFDERSITLTDVDQSATITTSGSQISLETGGESHQTDSLSITNSGGLTEIRSNQFERRQYRGEFSITNHPLRDELRIINRVQLEDYVASVIGGEMNFREFEALKTQAVVSRTYALWTIQNSPFPDFDLKDHESNQMYIGAVPEKPWYLDAALSTDGEILTWSGKLILSAYSSTCGGVTSNNEDVWRGRALPYLRSVQDHEMCSISPHYRWDFDFNFDELNELLRSRYGFTVDDVELERDHIGRVRHIEFTNNQNGRLLFTGNEFRLLINRTYNPLSVRSTRFNWDQKDDGKRIQISGQGLGHGIGLCQWGAKGFSKNGWDYREILSFYFSGTKVVNFHRIESNAIELHN